MKSNSSPSGLSRLMNDGFKYQGIWKRPRGLLSGKGNPSFGHVEWLFGISGAY